MAKKPRAFAERRSYRLGIKILQNAIAFAALTLKKGYESPFEEPVFGNEDATRRAIELWRQKGKPPMDLYQYRKKVFHLYRPSDEMSWEAHCALVKDTAAALRKEGADVTIHMVSSPPQDQ